MADDGRTQSKLLTMPPEIMRIILGYVLSTLQTIQTQDTEELDARIRYYDEALERTESGDHKECDNEMSDNHSDTGKTNEQEGLDHDTAILIYDLDDKELGQKRICDWLTGVCDHKRQKWFHYDPRVLAVSRRMKDDGQGLLTVNKSIEVQYWYQDSPSPRLACYTCGQSSVAMAFARYPELRNVTSWFVNIVIDVNFDLEEMDQHDKAWNGICDVTKVLQADIVAMGAVGRMQSLSLRFDVLDEGALAMPGFVHTGYYRYFANQFRSLRAENFDLDIAIDEPAGIVVPVAEEITSCRPSHSLPDAYHRIFCLREEIIYQSDGVYYDSSCWRRDSSTREAKDRYGWIDCHRYASPPLLALPKWGDLDGIETEIDAYESATACFDVEHANETILTLTKRLNEYITRAHDHVAKLWDQANDLERYQAAGSKAKEQPGPLTCICAANILKERPWASQKLEKVQAWRQECAVLTSIHEARRDHAESIAKKAAAENP